MNTVLKRIISCIILICILFCSITRVSRFLQLKESDNRYSSFFVEKQPIDVLFLGSSHVRHGFYPMELWADYGISSYNLAANGSTLPVSYWTLVNALDYKKPEVVVLDVFDMWPGRVCSESWGQVHAQFDAFPLSIHKFQMILDLFNDEDMTDGNGVNIYEKRWELLFDLGEYHTRWTELTEDDFDDNSQVVLNSEIWKGPTPLIAVVDRDEHIYSENIKGLKYDDLSKEYLKKTIDLCKKEEIKLILINTGYDCSDESKLFADSVDQIAKDNEIEYIDFTKEDIIDFNTDLYSTGHNTHVNSSGAQKFTQYIGEKLLVGYNLTDHREDSLYQKWWSDYDKYLNSKHDYLVAQEDIINYLMLLKDDDYKVLIEVRDGNILENKKLTNMLGNLGIKFTDNSSNLICVNVESGECNLLSNTYMSGDSWETIFGNLTYFSNDEGLYGIYLDDEELYTANTLEDDSQIKICVYSKSSGSWIDIKSFAGL